MHSKSWERVDFSDGMSSSHKASIDVIHILSGCAMCPAAGGGYSTNKYFSFWECISAFTLLHIPQEFGRKHLCLGLICRLVCGHPGMVVVDDSTQSTGSALPECTMVVYIGGLIFFGGDYTVRILMGEATRRLTVISLSITNQPTTFPSSTGDLEMLGAE